MLEGEATPPIRLEHQVEYQKSKQSGYRLQFGIKKVKDMIRILIEEDSREAMINEGVGDDTSAILASCALKIELSVRGRRESASPK
jgi:hypothetical protein